MRELGELVGKDNFLRSILAISSSLADRLMTTILLRAERVDFHTTIGLDDSTAFLALNIGKRFILFGNGTFRGRFFHQTVTIKFNIISK